jgi:tetratricopeptide (TPR) repeat protein
VEEQRAGELEKARNSFSTAQELNSNNVPATVNLAFNQELRAGSNIVLDLSEITADRFGKYRSWNEVLGANGPFDEISFCFEYGQWLVGGGLARQATAQFARVRQLAPDNLATRLFLAQIYVLARKPDRALEALADPLAHPGTFALTRDNSTELDVLAAAAHFQKNENAAGAALLDREIARHPTDDTLLLASAQSFIMRGLYTNALQVINRKLALSPDDSQWLYGKGLVNLQMGAYNEAAAALSRFLELNTNNPDALYNRGFAYFKAGQLEAAKADFDRLQAGHTNNFQLAYGLGEIAWQQHQTNEAIRNYRIYLANASTNFVEYKTVRERVSRFDGK